LLSDRFEAQLGLALKLIAAFFLKLNRKAAPHVWEALVVPILAKKQAAEANQWEKCLGAGYQALGVGTFLEVLQFNLELDPKSESFEECSNLWQIKIILKRVKNQQVADFVCYLLPAISRLA